MATREQQIQTLNKDWAENPRWKGVKRNYTAEDVVNLRGSVQIEHTLAKRGSEKLWNLLHTEPFVNALGALTGNQAMQQVKAGLKDGSFTIWKGPIVGQDGKEILAKDAVADDKFLSGINFYVKGVEGKVPSGK